MAAHVCIIDDDDAVRDSLHMLLESHGFACASFASARAFLDAFDPGHHHCAVVDVRMPDMDGLELLRRLRAKGGDLPVIVITGHADVPLAVEAMKRGAADFLEKPYEEDRLVAAVRSVLIAPQPHPAADGVVVVRDPEIAARLERLTPREREVLDHIVAGHANKVIAFELAISPRTVEIHRARVMAKMQAQNLSELLRLALNAGVAGITLQAPNTASGG